MDIEVIDKVNANSQYMKKEEVKIIMNCLKGMYEGSKTIILNYGQITDYVIEIIAEALKPNKFVYKLDLNTNKISEEGAKYLGEALKINKNLTTLKLSFNKVKDQGC